MTEEPRQRVERAGGRARRAKLTPAPGTDPSPEAPVERADDAPPPKRKPESSDDERLTQDRPPHWRQT